MEFSWGRELAAWIQYFLFSCVAVTVALYFYAGSLKGTGKYYCWFLCIFVGLSAIRFFVLYVLTGIRIRLM